MVLEVLELFSVGKGLNSSKNGTCEFQSQRFDHELDHDSIVGGPAVITRTSQDPTQIESCCS